MFFYSGLGTLNHPVISWSSSEGPFSPCTTIVRAWFAFPGSARAAVCHQLFHSFNEENFQADSFYLGSLRITLLFADGLWSLGLIMQ